MNSNRSSNNNVTWKPSGFHSVTPYLSINNCDEAIKFYITAFNARELFRLNLNPSNPSEVSHSEIQIGDSRIMIGEERQIQEGGLKSAKTLGASPVTLQLYVEDADAAFNQAIQAGATQILPPTDMFWGDRMGSVMDPYGHKWSLSTHIENVPVEELAERMKSCSPSSKGEYALKKKSADVPYRPDGFHTITPILTIKNCSQAVEYYKRALNAFEIYHLPHPSSPDAIMFADLQIGDSRVLMSEAVSSTDCEMQSKSPLELGGTCCSLYLYVENVDAAYKKAIDAGAISKSSVVDQFWGDRFGSVEDPYGYHWAISTHFEDLTPEQILEKAKTFTDKGSNNNEKEKAACE